MTGPHDRFFRYVFNHPARAEALLRYNLPEELAAEVDWSTLRREPDTLVEPERETRNDLLFSARRLHGSEEEPPHYFIIEHQSQVERWMARRLHDYAKRLMDHWCEVNPQSQQIPEVTALVVYTRRGRRWWAPRRLEELYSVPARGRGRRRRRRLGVRFEYLVDDLSAQSERKVLRRPGSALGSLVLLILSFAGSKELARRLYNWRELFAQVYAAPHGQKALYRVLRYLHRLGDEEAHTAAKQVLQSFMEATRAEALMRTMEEVLKERGRREGLAKGQAKALLRLLASRGIHVDDTSRERIQQCRDLATLDLWFERALSATRLADVLGEHSS